MHAKALRWQMLTLLAPAIPRERENQRLSNTTFQKASPPFSRCLKFSRAPADFLGRFMNSKRFKITGDVVELPNS
jgi:hypothetical protein